MRGRGAFPTIWGSSRGGPLRPTTPRTWSRLFFLLALLGLALPLPACGGGGSGSSGSGGNPEATALFRDGYHFMGFGIQTQPNLRPLSQCGVLVSNGVDAFDGTSDLNSAGVVTENFGLGAHFFVEEENRDLFWYPELTPDLEEARGRVGARGEVAAVSLTLDGTVPGLLTNIRKAGFWTLDRLFGDYHVVGMRSGAGGDVAIAQMGRARFDGIGGLSMSLAANRDGALFAEQTFASSYLVTIDGTVHINIPGIGGADLRGGATPGADLIIVCGGRIEGQAPEMLIFVREDSDASARDLDGSFSFFAIEYRGASSVAARVGRMTADGQSAFTLDTIENLDGTPGPSAPDSGSFSIAADGALTLSYGGRNLVGGLFAGGRFGAAAGSTVDGEPPALCLLLR